jgi:hypothetical protein
VCEKVAEEVHQIAEKGWLPLTLGGDHSLVSQGKYIRISLLTEHRASERYMASSRSSLMPRSSGLVKLQVYRCSGSDQ